MASIPIVETPRLTLGPISCKDVPRIVEFAGNKKVSDMTLNIPYPYEEKDAIFWINMANKGIETKSQYTFAIRTKSDTLFIGGVGLRINQRFNWAELGYWIAEPFWGRGYASEAVNSILEYGFENIKLHKIFATHLEENPASGKVMIKNGMIKEAELKDHTKKGDTYKTLIQYRLTVDEYHNLKA